MKYKELDTVVLCNSIPEHHLETGDVGAVVSAVSYTHLTLPTICSV